MKSVIIVIATLLPILCSARTLNGHVSYADGENCAGASVSEVSGGTNATAITNGQGDFTIEVTDASFLVISQIACETALVPVGDNETLNITLADITPSGVDFIDTIIENAALVKAAINQELGKMSPGSSVDIYYDAPAKSLCYLYRIAGLDSFTADPSIIYQTMLKGYLEQMKADGTLDIFISRMNNTGVTVAIAVADPSTPAHSVNWTKFGGNDFRAMARKYGLL